MPKLLISRARPILSVGGPQVDTLKNYSRLERPTLLY